MDATIKIPSELFAVAESSSFEGALALDSLEVGPDLYSFDGPVAYEVTVTNTGSALLVTGTAKASASCPCSRCLEPVAYDLEGDIEGFFLLDPNERDEFAESEDAPGEDEFDVLPADHIIDLEPLISAALIVAMDGQPLCSEDCKGLCPVCGANLNEEDCGCGQGEDLREFQESANPFAALANFEFSDN